MTRRVRAAVVVTLGWGIRARRRARRGPGRRRGGLGSLGVLPEGGVPGVLRPGRGGGRGLCGGGRLLGLLCWFDLGMGWNGNFKENVF